MIQYVQKYCNYTWSTIFKKNKYLYYVYDKDYTTRNVNFSDIVTKKLQENNKIIVLQIYNIPDKVPILCK
jgi:hypothetical protein